jgi:hypothetical protein
MIITDKSVFLHIPKTGGMWLRNVLEPIAVQPFNPKDTVHLIDVPKKDEHKYRFVFVRNPWAWYVSWFNYHKHGSSEEWLTNSDSLLFNQFNGESFEFFLKNSIDRNSVFRKKMNAIFKLQEMKTKTNNTDHTAIIYNNCQSSMYNCAIEKFSVGATKIGKMETLRIDLINMLEVSGEINKEMEHRVKTIECINRSVPVDYRNYYTTELRDLVAKDSAEYIDKFSYKF